MKKEYLGDAVYAQMSESTGDLVLTTEDGIRATNTVVLEAEVIVGLISYLKRNYSFRELCR